MAGKPGRSGRKPAPSIYETSKALATITSAEDVPEGAALASIPPEDMPQHLQHIPEKARHCLCLRARGLSFGLIGKRLGMTKEGARDLYLRHDPQGVFYLSVDIRRKLAEIEWETVQATGQAVGMAGVDELSSYQAFTIAAIAADKLRDIKRLAMEDKRIDMVVDNSSLAGLRAIDVESSEAEPA